MALPRIIFLTEKHGIFTVTVVGWIYHKLIRIKICSRQQVYWHLGTCTLISPRLLPTTLTVYSRRSSFKAKSRSTAMPDRHSNFLWALIANSGLYCTEREGILPVLSPPWAVQWGRDNKDALSPPNGLVAFKKGADGLRPAWNTWSNPPRTQWCLRVLIIAELEYCKRRTSSFVVILSGFELREWPAVKRRNKYRRLAVAGI